MKIKMAILFACWFSIVPFAIYAQMQQNNKYAAANWQLTDFATDSVYGTSVTKAFTELLKDKKSTQVIVAVIDAGLDTAHEDIQGHVWTNKKEIAGNNIDDDKNGYVDDTHGWNFIGGKDGRNITTESLESAREYYRLHALFAGVSDSATVAANQKQDYHTWLKLSKEHVEDSATSAAVLVQFSAILSKLDSVNTVWSQILKKDSISVSDIQAGTATDATTDSLRSYIINFYNNNRIPQEIALVNVMERGKAMLSREQSNVNSSSVDPNAARRDIVGDQFDDINDRNYGNNNVAAGVPSHGTHVAGIIAASRNNNLGMDGITDNVLIMPVRAVPDGDERDKDVALAIRYAVDNGARIINMSFGKPYSPGKKWVDDAVKYAEQKDVLLIHAAGNSGQNIDTVENFPNPVFVGTATKAPNYVTVGASAGGPDSLLAASFSNYGHHQVDLFAPGVRVYSTVPGSKYDAYSGTSMATPVVAGIAALILEYYPSLSAKQVKYVLENSVAKYPEDIVSEPGTGNKVDFSMLSVTGGIANAYNALKLAATLKGEHKMK